MLREGGVVDEAVTKLDRVLIDGLEMQRLDALLQLVGRQVVR